MPFRETTLFGHFCGFSGFWIFVKNFKFAKIRKNTRFWADFQIFWHAKIASILWIFADLTNLMQTAKTTKFLIALTGGQLKKRWPKFQWIFDPIFEAQNFACFFCMVSKNSLQFKFLHCNIFFIFINLNLKWIL